MNSGLSKIKRSAVAVAYLDNRPMATPQAINCRIEFILFFSSGSDKLWICKRRRTKTTNVYKGRSCSLFSMAVALLCLRMLILLEPK